MTARRVVIATERGPTREHLAGFFAGRGLEVCCLDRAGLCAAPNRVHIEDEQVWLEDTPILDNALGAVVTDSGYMWPLPMLEPTEEQWAEQRGRFDDYLRDERESASLWLSLMEILEDRLPVSVNPPPAFELAAMKPLAFDSLRQAGVPVPPVTTTNDPTAVADLVSDHGDELLAFELLPGARPVWVDTSEVDELELREAPRMFQALAGRQTRTIMVVGGCVVAGDLPGEWLEAFSDHLPVVGETLRSPWATLVLRQGREGPVLSDFSPSPDLASIESGRVGAVVEAVGRLLLADEPPPADGSGHSG